MWSLVLPFYVEWFEQISWVNNILFLGNYICCAFNSFFKWPSLILLCTKCFQIHSRWYLFFLVYWIILFSTTVQRTISNKRGTLFIYSSQFIQFNVRERILKERDVCILKAQRLHYEYKFRSYVVLWSFVMHHLLSYYQGMYHFISSLE